MGRYIGAKRRIARRCGMQLYKGKRISKKSHAPGMHGSAPQRKSMHGLLLNAKRAYAAMNGHLRLRTLVATLKKAGKKKWLHIAGDRIRAFAGLVESRLENMVYRLGFAPTMPAIQQLISHGHISVNGKPVTVRSFLVLPGMKISIEESALKEHKDLKRWLELRDENEEPPVYLRLCEDKYSADALHFPRVEEIPYISPVDIPKVCEYVSVYI